MSKTPYRKEPEFNMSYTPHGIGDDKRMRVWRTGWYGNQFEILSKEEFQTLQSLCKRFSIPLRELNLD